MKRIKKSYDEKVAAGEIDRKLLEKAAADRIKSEFDEYRRLKAILWSDLDKLEREKIDGLKNKTPMELHGTVI